MRAPYLVAMMAIAAVAAAATGGCGSGATQTRTGSAGAGTGTSPSSTSTPPNGATSGTVTHLREVNAPWRLAAVRAEGRVLVLRYDASGCMRGDGHAIVSESKQRVLITVREHEYMPGDPVNGVAQTCVDVQHFPFLRVRLATQLAGRPVLGGPRLR